MRFAALASVLAAVAAAPLAAMATGPKLSQAEFLSAVRCTAYDSLAQFAKESPHAALARMRLNAEARDQPGETAREARAVAADVARQGARADSAEEIGALRGARARACAQAVLAQGEREATPS